ncbi:hypothetical protein D0Z07_8780 [Hyphodiscus hymeniophilus]|uniref:Uncharacterized protein n=1 Tax=Hyphodiscus hymeniophilus TaxID=353542 RepID=A0A9P6SPQ3_9HELO|nr:hypothetical protein D0Z07_8780 [Hyphodiscus hymeniophilus]
MASHSTQDGIWNGIELAASDADQSSADRFVREGQLEKERRERDRKARRKKLGAEVSKRLDRKKLPDLPESYIYPTFVRLREFINLVENWMTKFGTSVAACTEKDLDDQSLVSVFGGEISQRPAIDVGIWKVGEEEEWMGRSSGGGIDDSQRLPTIESINCKYNDPLGGPHFDIGISDRVAELAPKPAAIDHLQLFERDLDLSL